MWIISLSLSLSGIRLKMWNATISFAIYNENDRNKRQQLTAFSLPFHLKEEKKKKRKKMHSERQYYRKCAINGLIMNDRHQALKHFGAITMRENESMTIIKHVKCSLRYALSISIRPKAVATKIIMAKRDFYYQRIEAKLIVSRINNCNRSTTSEIHTFYNSFL